MALNVTNLFLALASRPLVFVSLFAAHLCVAAFLLLITKGALYS